MKTRTFANRIEQLGRISALELELIKRNKRNNRPAPMTRTNKAKRILWQYMQNVFGRVLDTTNPADKEELTARSYTNAQFQGKQEEGESQNDTPRRFAVVVTTNDRRPMSHTYETQTTAEIVYNKIKRLLIRLGYTLADSGGNDISKGLCELWIKGSISRNIEIYPML